MSGLVAAALCLGACGASPTDAESAPPTPGESCENLASGGSGDVSVASMSASLEGRDLHVSLSVSSASGMTGTVETGPLDLCLHAGEMPPLRLSDEAPPGPSGAVGGVGHALSFQAGSASYVADLELTQEQRADLSSEGLTAVASLRLRSGEGTDQAVIGDESMVVTG